MLRRSAAAATGAVLLLLTAAACSPARSGPDPSRAPTASIGEPTITADLRYVQGGSSEQELDACIPGGGSAPRPVVVVVHGGSFTSGDKATAGPRYLCTRLARAGYAAFSVNYRLLPDHPYPAALRDLQAAIAWLRRPAQVQRFDLDPTRVGALGESAGALLVAENGTAGTGSLSEGSRVRAAIGLSTAPDLRAAPAGTPAQAIDLALAYLGCDSLASCPAASRASAITGVDRSDPPFLLVSSKRDWIPAEGSRRFAAALRAVDVPAEVVVEPGAGHGLGLVDHAVLTKILGFLRARL